LARWRCVRRSKKGGGEGVFPAISSDDDVGISSRLERSSPNLSTSTSDHHRCEGMHQCRVCKLYTMILGSKLWRSASLPPCVLCGTADVVGCDAKGFNVRDRYALGKGRGGCKKHTQMDRNQPNPRFSAWRWGRAGDHAAGDNNFGSRSDLFQVSQLSK
jgi:hypothetical protein